MKIKAALLMLLLAVFSLPTSAQTTIIKGLLLDSVTHEGEPYATVRVYKGTNTKGSADAMSVTDEQGHVSQSVSGRGLYTVVLSSVGRKTIMKGVNLSGQRSVDLGTMYIEDDAQQLEGVTVVAQKPLVKMTTDKTTYDVQSDVDSKSQTVLDMLRKVPMVTVDGQDNIQVKGSSSFKVYVDGKPSIMFSSNPSQIFKSMPASAVKSIEVETNPGAKYDAEGTGGILNIVMADAQNGDKQSMNGYNGSIRASIYNHNWNGSVFVSGQQGKLTYSANVFTSQTFPMSTRVSFDRTTNQQSGGYDMSYYQESKSRTPFAMGHLSLGYAIDSMQQIDATVGMTRFALKNNGHPTTTFSGGTFGDGFSYSNLFDMKQRNFSIDASLDYQRFLNKAKTSSITLTYLFNNSPNHNSTRTTYDSLSVPGMAQAMPLSLVDMYSDVHARGTEHIGQIDYVTPLGSEKHTLSAGAKFTARTNHSDSRYYNIVDGSDVYNSDNSSEYRNNVDILAGYAEYSGTFGIFSTRLGARYEQTWERVKFEHGAGDNFHRNYGNFVPTASFTWSLAAATNIGLSYSMRIVRPGISYLNPYVDRSNPTMLTYGNPDLDVEKSHNINLVFNHFSSKFVINATLSQNFCNNQIYQYSFMDGAILNQTYGNIVKNRYTSGDIFASWSPTTKTRLMGNFSLGYTDTRSDRLAYSNSGWSASGFINFQQTLWWDLKWSIGAFAKTKDVSLQGLGGEMNMMYTTLAKDIIKDKLNVSLMFVTPFSNRLHINNETFNDDFNQRMRIGVDMRSIGLTVTWNFGNTKRMFQQRQSKASSDFSEHQTGGQQMGTMGSGALSSGSGVGM